MLEELSGLTGNITLFGINIFGIALSQLVLLLCVVVLLFLFVLEAEFRQVRKLAKKMDEEELILTKELRELKDSVHDMGIVLKENFDIDVNDLGGQDKKDNIQKPS
jgi:predicted PurR-regulated permease PerM